MYCTEHVVRRYGRGTVCDVRCAKCGVWSIGLRAFEPSSSVRIYGHFVLSSEHWGLMCIKFPPSHFTFSQQKLRGRRPQPLSAWRPGTYTVRGTEYTVLRTQYSVRSALYGIHRTSQCSHTM